MDRINLLKVSFVPFEVGLGGNSKLLVTFPELLFLSILPESPGVIFGLFFPIVTQICPFYLSFSFSLLLLLLQ